MDKTALKADIIKIFEADLKKLQLEYNDNKEETNADVESVQELDDLSHKWQAQETLDGLEKRIREAEANINKIAAIDFSKADVIKDGAVAKVNGQYFVVGIPTCQFAFRDENYIAISPDAPFYLPLINKKPNDHFEYGSKLYKIEAVY